MNECRRLYEREGLGYGRLAQKYGMTKAGIQSLARRGKWQRDPGVLPAQKERPKVQGDGDSTSKVTGNAVAGETQSGYSYPRAPEKRLPVAPPTCDSEPPPPPPDSWAFKIAEPSADLTPMMRRDWVRRECEILAQKTGSRHELELRSLQNSGAPS